MRPAERNAPAFPLILFPSSTTTNSRRLHSLICPPFFHTHPPHPYLLAHSLHRAYYIHNIIVLSNIGTVLLTRSNFVSTCPALPAAPPACVPPRANARPSPTYQIVSAYTVPDEAGRLWFFFLFWVNHTIMNHIYDGFRAAHSTHAMMLVCIPVGHLRFLGQ